MTTTSRAEPRWQVPRLAREERVITGVAAGTARELGVEPVVTRAALVVLTIAGGWGVVVYFALWLLASIAAPSTPFTERPKGRSEKERHLAVALFTVGTLLLIRALRLGFVDSLVWPTAALAFGFVVVWHRHRDDEASVTSTLTLRSAARATGLRILAGIAMAAGGVTALIALNLDLGAARNVVLGAAVVLAGLALILGPWIARMIGDLTRERRLRIRSEERTEVAAHLHDSVLQTLALIQRNSDDKNAMVQLARRQERELRDWLYGGGQNQQATLRRAFVDLGAELEELHGIPVEVVVVGDLELSVDTTTSALLGATREAIVNAAKHSGSDKVDLFAEVTEGRIDVFVRDTGNGFDVDQIAPDRRGISDSIHGRMARVGGTCEIVSGPDEGTEVELSVTINQEGEG